MCLFYISPRARVFRFRCTLSIGSNPSMALFHSPSANFGLTNPRVGYASAYTHSVKRGGIRLTYQFSAQSRPPARCNISERATRPQPHLSTPLSPNHSTTPRGYNTKCTAGRHISGGNKKIENFKKREKRRNHH